MWHQQVRRRAVATYLPLAAALQPRPARAGGGSGSGGGPGRQAGRCGGGAVGRAAAQAERRSGAVGGPCRCGLVVSRNVGLPVTSAQRIKENCCCWRPCRCGPAACGCLVGGEAGAWEGRRLAPSLLEQSCCRPTLPAVAILDEPTSGMDPYTRRLTWRIIQKRCAAGSAILLTSHRRAGLAGRWGVRQRAGSEATVCAGCDLSAASSLPPFA